MTRKEKALTEDEKTALALVADGADVYAYSLAVLIRKIQHDRPELITVTEPLHAPKNGAQQRPYFGVILTAKGKRACGIGVRPPASVSGEGDHE